MKYFFHSFLALSVFIGMSCSSGERTTWKGETPESQGISSQAILDFIEAAERERPNDLHSFVLLRHGQQVAKGWWHPYDQESRHTLYSLSKSFTSTAIGLAQAEGLLSVNDPVISFFPDETPENPSENLKAMRIRDLLKMNSGHNQEPSVATVQNTESWVKGFLSAPVEHKPGTHFVYNSMATFMLSAIIQKVTKQTLSEYLTPRIFQPLGIENPKWEKNPQGIDFGGWGLNIRTQDIANFGQLYLQKGKWEGKQLIPEAWVEEATSFQTSNGSNPDSDWEQGYGYQFWMSRHGLYRGDGAFGQYCIVFPEQEAVLAITSGSKDMGAIMNLVWKHLLPAFKEEPLQSNDVAYKALQEKTASLKLNPAEGEKSSTIAEKVSGVNYSLEENDWGWKTIAFKLTDDNPSVTFSYNDSTYSIPIGFGEYKEGNFIFPQRGSQSVATSAGWIAGDTLKLMMFLDETPHGYMNKISFDNDKFTMERELNVSFGPTKQKPLMGKMKK
jgi:CubicO group peptidase (beta-lactamase class C family)